MAQPQSGPMVVKFGILMINFTEQYSKHRFEINNDAAIRSNILISSKLLILAKIITEDEIKF